MRITICGSIHQRSRDKICQAIVSYKTGPACFFVRLFRNFCHENIKPLVCSCTAVVTSVYETFFVSAYVVDSLYTLVSYHTASCRYTTYVVGGKCPNYAQAASSPPGVCCLHNVCCCVCCCCCCLFLTLTLVKNLESVVTQRCCSPMEDPKNQMKSKFGREILRFPAWKCTIRKKAHKWKGPMCKLNSHGRGYPLNYSIEFPRSHS